MHGPPKGSFLFQCPEYHLKVEEMLGKQVDGFYLSVIQTCKFINSVADLKPKFYSRFTLEDVATAFLIPEFWIEFNKIVDEDNGYVTEDVAIAFRALSKTKKFHGYRSRIAYQALATLLPAEELSELISQF